jgi:hypothetical protein
MIDRLLALTIPGSGQISLPGQIAPIAKANFGTTILSWGIQMAIVFGAITALAFTIYAGWKWITSQGDSKNTEIAYHMIMYAAIGFGVIALSTFLINIAASFICVPLFGYVPPSCH